MFPLKKNRLVGNIILCLWFTQLCWEKCFEVCLKKKKKQSSYHPQTWRNPSSSAELLAQEGFLAIVSQIVFQVVAPAKEYAFYNYILDVSSENQYNA